MRNHDDVLFFSCRPFQIQVLILVAKVEMWIHHRLFDIDELRNKNLAERHYDITLAFELSCQKSIYFYKL